ncbi:MAG: hypothetical protein V4682_02870 [Patescibacteria group bacterium]
MSLASEEVRKFIDRVQVAGNYHRELLSAVHLKTHQASLETMLSEQFVFNMVVYWEVFVSDLLLSYLVMSPAQYRKTLREKIQASIKDRYGSAASRTISFRNETRLSLAQAAALVDPKDFNISVISADNLAKRANEILAAKYAKSFTLDPDDRQFVDFLISIRNYLAHRSQGSRTALRSAVTSLRGINSDLSGNITNVGTYLKAKNAADETRALVIARRLEELALKL